MNPLTSQVVPLLNDYFAAINAHDYQKYIALLTPQASEDLTAVSFSAGYSSSPNSGETLTGISTAADGDPVAQVTFISHQNVSTSAKRPGCTAWNISLFLAPGGSDGYLIGKSPAGYHASYAACP